MKQFNAQKMHGITLQWMQVQYDVSGYISACIPDFHDAQDVFQQVAVVIIQKSDQYDPNCSFRGWVLSIAHYEVLKYRQRFAREKLVFDQDLIDRVTKVYQDSDTKQLEVREALNRCLQHIKGRNQDALQMWYGKQMNSEQIAARLGIKKRSLYMMLQRVKASLRECVQRRLAYAQEDL